MNDEFGMTNGADDDLSNCPPEELSFWGLHLENGEALELKDQGPPLVYDSEERTSVFGEMVIAFAKKIAWNPVNNRLIAQLVGAATSVGANYCEADDGVSRADFRHRIGICRKEARETKFFLRMVVSSEPGLKPEAREL
jgi:four helix bundle protein